MNAPRRIDRIEIERDTSRHTQLAGHRDYISIYTTKWNDRGSNQWDAKLIRYHGSYRDDDQIDHFLKSAINELLDNDILDYF